MLKDPKRLYAPGRMFHIIDRKSSCCCRRRSPPEVRAAIPVEGRFEHVVLSCTATSDHSIVWIEREAQRALDIMRENDEVTTPPTCQNMEKGNVTVDTLIGQYSFEVDRVNPADDQVSSCSDSISSSTIGRSEWDELVEDLLDEGESEDLVLKDDIAAKL